MNLSNKLADIVHNTQDLTSRGYYKLDGFPERYKSKNRETFKEAINQSNNFAIFTELKFSSPTTQMKHDSSTSKAKEMLKSFVKAGSDGLSILTEPTYFKGSLRYLDEATTMFPRIPILMKDFILYPIQIDAAKLLGASTILLIAKIQSKANIQYLVDYAHDNSLEVLLEVNNANEMEWALDTKADVIGINNRNLDTFQIDIRLTETLLTRFSKRNKPVISLSGVKTIDDVNKIKKTGANGILVGTMLSNADDPVQVIQKLKLV